MTIIAMQLLENGALMGCDGVSTDPRTGAVHGYLSKIDLLPEHEAMIGISGCGGFNHLMRWFLPGHVEDFDDLIEVLPALVEHVHFHILEHGLSVTDDTRTSVMIVGWSRSDKQCKAYRVVTYAKESVNADTRETTVLEPFELYPVRVSGMWSSTSPDREIMERFGVFAGIEEDEGAAMTRLICAGRAASGSASAENEQGVRFNAGGFVQLALLRPGLVQSWIAHRWPEDVLGEPIDPSRGVPMPDYLRKP